MRLYVVESENAAYEAARLIMAAKPEKPITFDLKRKEGWLEDGEKFSIEMGTRLLIGRDEILEAIEVHALDGSVRSLMSAILSAYHAADIGIDIFLGNQIILDGQVVDLPKATRLAVTKDCIRIIYKEEDKENA